MSLDNESPDGFECLREVLHAAYDQAANGKGKERHGNNMPFKEQPLFQITNMVGIGGPSFQAIKKIQEANTMANRGQINQAIRELHGAIVYTAAVIIALEDSKIKS